MTERWSLYKNNKGASLIAVLVAMAFVGIIGVLVMNITITNIQMKTVEEYGKRNFYSAEAVMNEVSEHLNDIAYVKMQKAYTEILGKYKDILSNGKDVQAEFAKLYMDELMDKFWVGSAANLSYISTTDLSGYESYTKTKTDGISTTNLVYVAGYYSRNIIGDSLPDKINGVSATVTDDGSIITATYGSEATIIVSIKNDDCRFTANYTDGLLTLENVSIIFIDSNAFETKLTTDIVFHTPELNFDGTNAVEEYMKYSLIANQGISLNAASISIDGNVYAGAEGFYTQNNGSSTVFIGDTLVTRGDIAVKPGTSLIVGNSALSSRIWAENVTTTGKGGDPSSLTLRGYSYIADDLSLEAKQSKVTLEGYYYGYNFRENYASVSAGAPVRTDSSFSSAMIMNASKASLNLTGLKYLLLSGRTFISRGSDDSTVNDDIMLGESISVRTNQLAYSVAELYLEHDAFGAVAKDGDGNVHFSLEGKTNYSAFAGVTDIMDYLNPTKPIAIYCYRDNGILSYRYYLNFASEEKANAYFADTFVKRGGTISDNATAYTSADAILISRDSGMLMTLKGDIMYVYSEDIDAGFQVDKVSISGAEWAERTDTSEGGFYWEYADALAIKYKSLQTYLEDSHTGIDSNNIRFTNALGIIDKTTESLLDNLIDVSTMTADINTKYSGERVVELKDLGGGKKQVIILVDNAGSPIPYEISSNYVEGIVIATGNVKVMDTFKGMIICGGTVSFATNASVSADENLVSQLFSEDYAKGAANAEFSYYFKDYNTLLSSVIGEVQIDKYLTYDNWRKNEE